MNLQFWPLFSAKEIAWPALKCLENTLKPLRITVTVSMLDSVLLNEIFCFIKLLC